MAKRHRIPQYIDFPFNYTIEVKQVSHKTFIEEGGADAYALWFSDDRTILLDKSRPHKKRVADLVHELIHAVGDFQAHILGDPDKADATD